MIARRWLIMLGMWYVLAHSSVSAATIEVLVLPGVEPEMLSASFWVGKLEAPHKTLLTMKDIEAYNDKIQAAMPRVMPEFSEFQSQVSGAMLKRWLFETPLPRGQERYNKSHLVSASDYDELEQDMNVSGLLAQQLIQFGFTVRRTDLRTFPTDDISSEDEGDERFDLFQETAPSIAEPVVILHRSADGKWLFVQLYNYRGWLRTTDVAVASSRSEWQAKMAGTSFVVVTGTQVLPRDPVTMKPVRDWRAAMGTRLPFVGMEKEGYAVEIPQRNPDGGLYWKKAWIHGKADVSVGYLPYTKAGVLRQAFKMLGERYGWGGLDEGRDCSSFVMDIFRSFGLQAPRNADQQERVPRQVRFTAADTRETKYAVLEGLEPGITLHMRGHVMLYLGKHGNRHYAIHSLGSYGDAASPYADGSLRRVEAMRTVVSDLDMPLRSGRPFIDGVRSVGLWVP